MAITNKLITFNKLTSFETQLAQGNILETSIVFIKDAKKIWTKGTYFDCSGGGSSNIAIYETTDDVYSGELTFTQELLDLIMNEKIHNIIIISSIGVKAFFPFHRESYSANRSQFDCIVSKIWYSIIVEPISGTYQLLRRDLALKSDIPNTDDFATQANLTSAVTQLTTNIAKKQDKLVSGTNIATINNNSILGSGNFDLATTAQLRDYQPKLVSGTSIKTINGESILGSGDITISGGGSSGGGNEVVFKQGPVVSISPMRPNIVYCCTNVRETLIMDFEEPVSGITTYDVFTAVVSLSSSGIPVSLNLPDNVTWANGEIPTIGEDDYEVSISRMSDGNGFVKYYAVLTPFKSV